MAIVETTGEHHVQESPMKGIVLHKAGPTQNQQHIEFAAPGSFSQRTFVIGMPDDSLVPEIWPGEHVAFDPEVSPDAGDVVLLQDECGGLWIRKYRPLPKGQFDAIAANKDHAELSSRDGGLHVLAVMVGQWSGRRSKRRCNGTDLRPSQATRSST